MSIAKPMGLLSSAQALMRSGQERALRGAGMLSRPGGSSLLEGLTELRLAQVETRLGVRLARAEQGTFRSLLDIYA
jgi:hypothetical protein